VPAGVLAGPGSGRRRSHRAAPRRAGSASCRRVSSMRSRRLTAAGSCATTAFLGAPDAVAVIEERRRGQRPLRPSRSRRRRLPLRRLLLSGTCRSTCCAAWRWSSSSSTMPRSTRVCTMRPSHSSPRQRSAEFRAGRRSSGLEFFHAHASMPTRGGAPLVPPPVALWSHHNGGARRLAVDTWEPLQAGRTLPRHARGGVT
jgi:hypothetical protein